VLGLLESKRREVVMGTRCWYETFVVEVGNKEVLIEVHGIDEGEPVFKVETGTDWEGFAIPLSEQERSEAIGWVRENYGI